MMAERSETPTEENGGENCPQCGAALGDAGGACSACGWLPERICFCGAKLPRDAPQCPNCGAQWSKVVRIRRRSRSTRVKTNRLLRSALVGALAALLGGALGNLIISGLAQRSTPDGEIPADLGLRLYWAWHTLATASQALVSRIMGVELGLIFVTALVGAALGALWYLTQIGQLKWSKRSRRGASRHRAERRSTRHP